MFRRCALCLALGCAPSPVDAEVKLGMGGYMLGYGMATSQTETPGNSLRPVDFRKETRIEMTGETTLENGIEVRALALLYVDRADNRTADRGHVTFSGDFGQINAGENFGAPALLQVETPHADEHIDGIDPKINSFDVSEMGGGAVLPDTLSYQQETAVKAAKLTYITPVLNGFQAGLSYAPRVSEENLGSAAGAVTDNDSGEVDDAIEAALRYEWERDDWRVVAGAGVSHAGAENESGVAPDGFGSDDQLVYNMGGILSWRDLRGGVSYNRDNNATKGNGDTRITVYGLAYDASDDLTVGASYYDRWDEADRTGVGRTELDKVTWGGSYDYGPGMSLRATMAHMAVDSVVAEGYGHQLAIGTDLRF